MTALKENNYICGTCKYYNTKDCEVYKKYWCLLNDYDTCDDWTDDNEVEPTEEEKADIVGDREAHRRMVEGEGIW